MNEEGSVKYACERVATGPALFAGFVELNRCRRGLHEMGWIGVGQNGIGYGNVSLRCGKTKAFWISGAGTGRLPDLGPEHYARVVEYDFARNWIKCEGPVQASSESMTHAAIYAADASANAVIHVHDADRWKRLVDRAPTTAQDVAYGTPGMAREIGRLFAETDVARLRIVAMAGHQEGIITFGTGVAEAMDVLTAHFFPSDAR